MSRTALLLSALMLYSSLSSGAAPPEMSKALGISDYGDGRPYKAPNARSKIFNGKQRNGHKIYQQSPKSYDPGVHDGSINPCEKLLERLSKAQKAARKAHRSVKEARAVKEIRMTRVERCAAGAAAAKQELELVQKRRWAVENSRKATSKQKETARAVERAARRNADEKRAHLARAKGAFHRAIQVAREATRVALGAKLVVLFAEKALKREGCDESPKPSNEERIVLVGGSRRLKKARLLYYNDLMIVS